MLDAPLPLSIPITVPGSLKCTTPVGTFSSSGAAFTITKLDPPPHGTVEGSFGTTSLGDGNGGFVTVSGTFRVRR